MTKTILIVEDETFLRESLSEPMTGEGFEVLQAADRPLQPDSQKKRRPRLGRGRRRQKVGRKRCQVRVGCPLQGQPFMTFP